jgi:hypothetical protein
MDVKYAVYQLSYDSVHGRFKGTVEAGESASCRGGANGRGKRVRRAGGGTPAARRTARPYLHPQTPPLLTHHHPSPLPPTPPNRPSQTS